MENLDFDSLLAKYKTAINHWIETIRDEESLASSDHSMVSMEKWDAAGFAMLDAEAAAKKSREQYKNALRKKNYGF